MGKPVTVYKMFLLLMNGQPISNPYSQALRTITNSFLKNKAKFSAEFLTVLFTLRNYNSHVHIYK